ncbi:MAG: glycoside hydrolase domain-containing protein, partial [bacterium]
GVYAVKSDIADIDVAFSNLQKTNGETAIPSSAFTCFNTGGIDWEGKLLDKTCPVGKGKIQPLWMGVQIPEDVPPGKYEGEITVAPAGSEESNIHLVLNISRNVRKDAGDDEPWRHSRLHWLNSKIAIDDGIVSPYTPMNVDGNAIQCLGRRLTLNRTGLPESIQSFFGPEMTRLIQNGREILSAPIKLIVEMPSSKILSWDRGSVEITKQAEGAVSWKSISSAGPLQMDCEAQMEFDGTVEFLLTLKANKATRVKDIRLEIPIQKDVAKYMMGMGVKGGMRPLSVDWKWNWRHNQDGAWVGDVNAGIQCSFKDENYERPLNTNFYLSKPLNMPTSWFNDGKGGCRLFESGRETFLIRAYSGPRTIQPEEALHFNFRLLITPFRTIDTKAQWSTRFYHRFKPIDEIAETGANTINVHHATDINPFINYPFLRPQEMKAYIDEAHAKGMRVKIYYTVRELSNRAPELFALRSLGNEILSYGPGGGFSWLQEHLDPDYIAGWLVSYLKDAAVINRGVSRWHNYYLEGLDWLAKNVGIDGLYIDDVAFDRTIMKRVRKILDRNRDGALIDLHSANQFNVRDGYANSANLYLEHFPYIDRLWFGEYFDYNAPPDFWLVEMSGIPFGLMGEMLQGGGNAWRGMIFGMTSRLPWAGDPRPIWKAWDAFGIQDSRMIGYWAPSCPVRTNRGDILATVYAKGDEALISIASWAKETALCRLTIDWKSLGMNPDKSQLVAPAIQDFQEEAIFQPTDGIPVPPGKGWLLILKEK